jgi:putative NIF3 family GTP cyclohydrolase 1 type 2
VKGKKGKLEKVQEIRLEMVVPRWRLSDILRAMRNAHPYEEAAYDLYPLENSGTNYGMGAVGDLASPMTLSTFIARVKKVCNVPAVRAVGDLRAKVCRVAVVGGSGGSFLSDAIRSGADVFVTGDVRYHTFRAAEGNIALIDAGHAETERFVAEGLMDVVLGVLHSQNFSHIRVVKSTKTSEQITYA